MFFPQHGQKVSLGGKSSQGVSREEVLRKTKQEREKRQRRKAESQAATKLQAYWRGFECRRVLKHGWRIQLQTCLSSSSAVDILALSNPVLPLFHRVFRADSPADLPMLSRISSDLTAAIQYDKRHGIDAGRAIFHTSKTCSAILRTIDAQRDKLLPCLVSPLGADASPELHAASKAIQNLIALTSDSTWRAWRCGQNLCPLQSVIQALADDSLFRCLAALMAKAASYLTVAASRPIPAEELVLHLMSGYSIAARELSPRALAKHAPWLVLAVPGLLQCSAPILDRFRALVPKILEAVLPWSPKDLRGRIVIAAAHLSAASQNTSADVTICSLNMLSALVHGIHHSNSRMTAQHVVAFSRMGRLLVSLLPHAARMQLAGVLINVSGTHQGMLEVPVAKCFGFDAMEEDDDTDSAFTLGASWFLPSYDIVDSDRSLTPPDGALESVAFPTAVAATQVVTAQVDACVEDASFSAADSVREMTLWLFTVLSLSRADPLLSEKVVIAWATSPCQLIRVVWQRGLQMFMRDGLVASSSAVDLKTDPWQIEETVQPWTVPLMVLCRVYSQYVSTAPDDALFSDQVRYSQYVSTAPDDALFSDQVRPHCRSAKHPNCKPLMHSMCCSTRHPWQSDADAVEVNSIQLTAINTVQAPIPKTELVPDRGMQEAGEFIPFLREALYAVIFAGQHGTGSMPCSPAVSRPFKLLAGRLFGQLHSRAARQPDISDSCFQAKDLQHARFLRDVKLALGLVDLFGEDASDDDAEARLKSAYVDVLKYAPGMARFDDRAMVFQELVHRDREVIPHAGLVATIRRDHVFEDSLQLMSDLPSVDLKNRLRISFIDALGQPEAGIDGGGLFKDFIENLLKEAFHPDLDIFLQTEDGAMFPNPAAKVGSKFETDRSTADAFRLLGSMLGKAMYEGIIVELPLAAFFLKKLRGSTSDLNDLPSLDRQLYGNLMKMTDPALDLESVGVHFTIISTASGEDVEVPLMPGGENTPVTRGNLPLYLTLVADYRLNREIAAHAAAFMDGFKKLIEPAWLRMFNDRELQQLISGDSRGGFDLDDFREHVILGGGYHADHYIIQMFWRVLGRLDKLQQSAFLKFVTACSRPPLLGFKYMQPPIAINMRGHVGTADDETALPTASTCFNLLKLPPYRQEQTMLQKLLLAIEGAQTFDLS